MFASLPSDEAASSVSRLVATSRFDTVSANCSRLSVAMPSSPPIAMICNICSALVTWVLENSIALCLSDSNWASVPSTVLRMSRYAESMSCAAVTARQPSIVIAGVSVEYSVMPADLIVDGLRKLLPPKLVRSMRFCSDLACAVASDSSDWSLWSSEHSLAVSKAASICSALMRSSSTLPSASSHAFLSCSISCAGAWMSLSFCNDLCSASALPFASCRSSWTFCHLSPVSCMYFGMFLCSASTPDRRLL